MNQRYITLCLLEFNYEGNVPLADPIERCPYCLRIEFIELGQFSVDTFTSEVDGTDVSTVYLTGVLLQKIHEPEVPQRLNSGKKV